jgi:hypothetical protein
MSDTAASLRRKIIRGGKLKSGGRPMKAFASIGQIEQSVCALANCYRTVELGWGMLPGKRAGDLDRTRRDLTLTSTWNIDRTL